MAINPMQRKARNSFLLGMFITLFLCMLIAAIVVFLVVNSNKKKEQEEGKYTYAYALISNVESGEEITSAMVQSILVTEKAVPAGAFASQRNTSTDSKKENWVPVAFPSGYKSKVALNAGTILSSDLVYEGEDMTNDLRYVEYNMLVLPTTVDVGDYIDIRLTFGKGQDLIVISKKEIKTLIGDTLGFELTEAEMLLMNSAIVEAYIMPASKLHVVQYIEPGIQEEATKTYTPTTEVQQLIDRDPNIKDEARKNLKSKYNSEIRILTENEINKYDEETRQGNIESGIQEQIDNAKAAREAYLSGMTSY